MSLFNRFQTMGVDRDHALTIDGRAGTTSTHVLSTLCMDSHLKSPPPTTEIVDDSDIVLEYAVSASPLRPILDVVSSLRPQLVEYAHHVGMPEQMYLDTVTQWTTWVVVGADTPWPFTIASADALLAAALAAAGTRVSDEDRARCLQVLWQGVDLTIKTAGAVDPRFAAARMATAG